MHAILASLAFPNKHKELSLRWFLFWQNWGCILWFKNVIVSFVTVESKQKAQRSMTKAQTKTFLLVKYGDWQTALRALVDSAREMPESDTFTDVEAAMILYESGNASKRGPYYA